VSLQLKVVLPLVILLWNGVVFAQVAPPPPGVPPSGSPPQVTTRISPTSKTSKETLPKTGWVSFQEPSEFLTHIDFSKKFAPAPKSILNPKQKKKSLTPPKFNASRLEIKFRQHGFRAWNEKELPLPTTTRSHPQFLKLKPKLGKIFLFRTIDDTAYGIIYLTRNQRDVKCITLSPIEIIVEKNKFKVSAPVPQSSICEMAEDIMTQSKTTRKP